MTEEDIANGIKDIKVHNDAKDSKSLKGIYNLSGQRLSKIQKGVNVMKGKKVLY